jgi:hypothetical protein
LTNSIIYPYFVALNKGGFIMRTLLPMLAILLTISVSLAAQSSAKTFTKSFNLDGAAAVRLDLPGNIEIKEWDGAVLRFEISVSLPANQEAMLNELANVGRYNLSTQKIGTTLVVSALNLLKKVKVKGQELKEVVSFVVFVPRGTAVESSSAAVTLTTGK